MGWNLVKLTIVYVLHYIEVSKCVWCPHHLLPYNNTNHVVHPTTRCSFTFASCVGLIQCYNFQMPRTLLRFHKKTTEIYSKPAMSNVSPHACLRCDRKTLQKFKKLVFLFFLVFSFSPIPKWRFCFKKIKNWCFIFQRNDEKIQDIGFLNFTGISFLSL